MRSFTVADVPEAGWLLRGSFHEVTSNEEEPGRGGGEEDAVVRETTFERAGSQQRAMDFFSAKCHARYYHMYRSRTARYRGSGRSPHPCALLIREHSFELLFLGSTTRRGVGECESA